MATSVLDPVIVTPEDTKKNELWTQDDTDSLIKGSAEFFKDLSDDGLKKLQDIYGDIKGTEAFKILTNAKLIGLDFAMSWDDSKSTGENIANFTGSFIQGATIAAGTTVLVTSTGLVVGVGAISTVVTIGITYELRKAGYDLGDGLQDLYSEYIDTTIKISNLSGDKPLGSIEDTFLVNQLKKAEELKVKIGDVERQVKDYIGNKPVNENNPIKVELNKDNSIEIKNSDNTKSVISEDIQKNYNPDGNLVSSVSLKSGQTISHIAVGTKYTTKELLEFNNLSEVDARSLPVGFEVQIPKSVNNFEGGYGNIKEYIGQDGSVIYKIPDKNGDIKTIEINSKGEVVKNDFDTIEDIKDTTNQDILTPEQQDYIKKNSVAYKKDKEEDKVKEETHERDEDNSKIGGIIGGAIGGSIGSLIISNNNFSNIEKIAI